MVVTGQGEDLLGGGGSGAEAILGQPCFAQSVPTPKRLNLCARYPVHPGGDYSKSEKTTPAKTASATHRTCLRGLSLPAPRLKFLDAMRPSGQATVSP